MRLGLELMWGLLRLVGGVNCTFGEHRFSTSGPKDSVMEAVELGFIRRSDFGSILTIKLEC